LWWDSNGWHYNYVTAAAGGAPLAADRPAAYVFDAQGTQHVVYYAAEGQGIDGHLIELWWDPPATGVFGSRACQPSRASTKPVSARGGHVRVWFFRNARNSFGLDAAQGS